MRNGGYEEACRRRPTGYVTCGRATGYRTCCMTSRTGSGLVVFRIGSVMLCTVRGLRQGMVLGIVYPLSIRPSDSLVGSTRLGQIVTS